MAHLHMFICVVQLFFGALGAFASPLVVFFCCVPLRIDETKVSRRARVKQLHHNCMNEMKMFSVMRN